MKDKKQIVIELIKQRGPCLPMDIAKHMGLPTLIASALLSEMSHDKLVRYTRLKIGNSSLYYLPGQEKQIEQYLPRLKKKEKEVIEIVKQKGIVQDKTLEPSHRIALRNIPDFAIPLKVSIKNNVELFWKYFLLNNKEAIERIKNNVNVDVAKKESLQEDKTIEKKLEVKAEKTDTINNYVEHNKAEINKVKKVINEGRKIEKPKSKRRIKINVEPIVIEKIKESFNDYTKVSDGIYIATSNVGVGKLRYLCIVKNKLRINEADLSLAFQEGQSRSMPVIIFTYGKMTKKAETLKKKFGDFLLVSFINQKSID